MIPEEIKKKAYEKYPVKMGTWYDLWGNAEEEDTNEVARNAYAAGMLAERERLMKEAANGEIVKDISGKLGATAKVNLDGFKFGEKVRVIIVKLK